VHFAVVQLFTRSREAGSFYVSLGYRKLEDRVKVSHEKAFAG
jgi:hypothetical protein